jgi:hypothetical protein
MTITQLIDLLSDIRSRHGGDFPVMLGKVDGMPERIYTLEITPEMVHEYFFESCITDVASFRKHLTVKRGFVWLENLDVLAAPGTREAH